MIDGERLYDVLHDLGFDGEFVEDDTEIRIACPQCADDNKRLYIEAESGVWICFRCDERGDLFSLFNDMIGLGSKESFEKLREVRFRLAPPYRFADLEEEKTPPKVELPEEFKAFTLRAQSSVPFVDYMDAREVDRGMREAYDMGYCTEGDYAGRVIIPVHGPEYDTLYTFVARSIDPDEPKKVLYPPHSRPSETLFNLDRLRAHSLALDFQPGIETHVTAKPLVLTEGVFDALRLPDRAVAVLGSRLSETQITLLGRLWTEWQPFVVCMDGDEAGRRASKAIMRQLWGNMLPAREAFLPEGVDPGSAIRPVLEQAIADALPLSQF